MLLKSRGADLRSRRTDGGYSLFRGVDAADAGGPESTELNRMALHRRRCFRRCWRKRRGALGRRLCSSDRMLHQFTLFSTRVFRHL